MSIGMLALDNMNTEPGASVAGVVVELVIFDGELILLVSTDGTICATTLCCCEINGAAKMENITATAAIDDFSTKISRFDLFEVINSTTITSY